MLTSPRGLLIVALLSFSAVSVQARGGSSSVGQSNPGTVEIRRTIDPQALVSQVGATPAMTSSTGPRPSACFSRTLARMRFRSRRPPLEPSPRATRERAVLGAAGRDWTSAWPPGTRRLT